MLMAQLDTNIVVAALPAIGRDIGASRGIAGVTAIYLLTVTVSTPVLGKLGDLVGRRAVFAASVLLFATGSLACALAPSLSALVAARALQGIGGGGLVVTAVSALGEMFDRAELVRRQIWLTGVFAVASLAGPPLGGLLAAGPGWHWIFVINLPVCALALALGLRGLPDRRHPGVLAHFDAAGALLVALGGACVVLLGSSASLAASTLWAPLLAATAIACATLFIRVERRAISPLIPQSLFANPAVARSITVTALTGIALFGTFTFIPLALGAGTGSSGKQIGGLLLALTGGQLLTTTTFSLLARRYPDMVAWGRGGLLMGVAGLLLLAALPQLDSAPAPVPTIVALTGMALAGAALGLSMQSYTLLAQTNAPPDAMGAAMGTLTFARQLGGSIGAAGFGWLLLTINTTADGLTVVLAAAAGCAALALLVGPSRDDEPELSHEPDRRSAQIV